jgi:hypothetical protein
MVILCKTVLLHTLLIIPLIFKKKKVFEKRLISYILWPARTPDLNPYYCYLWGNLGKQRLPK